MIVLAVRNLFAETMSASVLPAKADRIVQPIAPSRLRRVVETTCVNTVGAKASTRVRRIVPANRRAETEFVIILKASTTVLLIVVPKAEPAETRFAD